MNKRFEREHNWIIDDNKRNTNESLIVYDEECNTLDDLCELLNQQQQRISELEEELKSCQKLHNELFLSYEKLKDKNEELEEQLKNAIVPKFKIGQEVWTIRHNNSIYHTRIDEIKVVGIKGENKIFYYYDQPGSYAHWEEVEDNLFATKEEALKKLQELGEER